MEQVEVAKRQAQVDALTRIWNRASIFELLQAELGRAKRASRGIGVIMADLDHFKLINDTHGHAAGDEVLRQAARRMLGAIREVDALGRYGGEEFMVVLGGCDNIEGAVAVAERILARMSEGPFNTEFGEIKVTLSLGLAFSPSPVGTNERILLKNADQALYRAKQNGRNRFEQSSLEPPIEHAA